MSLNVTFSDNKKKYEGLILNDSASLNQIRQIVPNKFFTRLEIYTSSAPVGDVTDPSWDGVVWGLSPQFKMW